MITNILALSSQFIKVIAQAYGDGLYGSGLYGSGEEQVIDLPGNLPDTGTDTLILLSALVAIGSAVIAYRKLSKQRQAL